MKTYGKLALIAETQKWELSEIQPHVAIRLKNIFPKIAKYSAAPFYFDHTPESCTDLRWFMERYPLEHDPADFNQLDAGRNSYLANQERLEQLMHPDYEPRAFAMKKPPRAYQSQAAEVWLANGVLLVGDDVGLGKTITALAGLCDSRTLPALIVVQTHLPPQWKEKIEEFTDLKVHIIKGTRPYQLPPADVYIMKYSCLSGWTEVFGMGIFKAVIFDEIQELRIPDSNKYRGARNVTRNVKFVMGLSATPIYNYGEEIFSILDVMKEGCLGSREDFLREWAGSFGRRINNPVGLGTYLREKFLFLRRTREDVKLELPPTNKIIHTVETDEDSLKSVEDMARMLAIKVTSGSFTERGMAARELDIMVRQATGIGKAKAVAQYVRILLENGEPVLLAGWHRGVYDIWLKELAEFNPLLYTGSESPAEKERSKQAFIKGDSNLMIISLRSGVGLDGLQERASIVVFGELDWSPMVHEQVTGRLRRDGQDEQVTAIYLVTEEGSDPPMVSLLGLKSSQARGIVDPLRPVQAQFSDESRVKLLAEQYLKKKGVTHADQPVP